MSFCHLKVKNPWSTNREYVNTEAKTLEGLHFLVLELIQTRWIS